MPQIPLERCLALDFETYYDDDYSIRLTSPWGYVYDERFDAYLVAACGAPNASGDLFKWVGNPKEFDWSMCHGRLLLAHNAGFDGLVFKRLQERGVIPADVVPLGWACTADMAAFLRCKRDLASCVRIMLGRPRSKKVRADMRGKTYQDACAAGMEAALLQYGGDDADDCYELWAKFSDQWPESEQENSRIIREGGWYGMQADVERVEAGIKTLRDIRDNALMNLPWADSHDDKPLSSAKLREQGRIDGIPVPASLSATSEDAQAWEDTYADQYPWVAAVRDYRRTNTFYSKVANLATGLDKNGVFHFSCKYHGAATGRGSGGSQYESGGKFNIQNMPRKAQFGVDIRGMLIARPGKLLVVPDYCQIEARYLLWAAGDKAFLEVLKREGNLYQAYAKMHGWYNGTTPLSETDKALYQRTKVTVLQLGYQSGAAKFRSTAKTMYKVEFTQEEAERIVAEYRQSNPKIVNLWREHHTWFGISARHRDPTHEIVLESGRILTYFEPHFDGREMRGTPVRGESSSKYYGGKLVENATQAATRDIMCDGRRAVCAAHPDCHFLFDAHDEVIFEVPENEAEDRAEDIARLLSTSSPWAEGCPIAVEYKIVDRYLKG